nr:hypothetical protein [Tanacetum cinerariifolium]
MKVLDDKVAKLDADLLEMALHLEEKFYPHILTTISGRSHAIVKGMQSGLSAGIDHGKACRSLKDVVAYNPSVEAYYNFALQRLREVDFPLLIELISPKDVSVADIMNLLRLESPLANTLRMSDLQPDVEQLILPIYRNVAAQQSALVDVLVPLVEPLSAENLTGVVGTSNSVPTIVATTTALSTTFASTSSVHHITIDDYEVVSADGQEDAQGNV